MHQKTKKWQLPVAQVS